MEEWLRVKQVINKDRGEDEESQGSSGLDQTQFKLRVRRDSDDSLGSELTLSLPSLGSDSDSDECSMKNEEHKNSFNTTRQRSKSGESNCDMFETSPSPKSKNSEDNAEICDSDDDIIFPPSPDVDLNARSVQRSQVKRRRVFWT